MIIILISLVISNEFYIENTGLAFLNRLLEIDIFSLFFICLCFLFIINGSNLIDGYNGLLGIHSLIILLNLFFVNYFYEKNDLAYLMLYGIIIIFIVIPLFGPTLFSLGFDPIWIGILIAMVLQSSFLTPPFGFSLFYLRGVAPKNISTSDIYKGVYPFIGLQILVIIFIS